ncbi:GntR family transcriptional regulator [Leucobacter soli]|uniref:HTH-type transcriptional repressor YtrA n=1 Tax=Leucobacter soli TaxID=2812850 RepID=A0A916JVL0_9MICO|nr:GntR family transcriptional regulator [Leucobacter soli]CAG7606548.1 HTH-type transcriptional repressor YtrA [Leucobacter soli]
MFDDSRPIFQQLADRIIGDILRGRYAEGQQVPSTNELSGFLRINPATAGKALGLLVDRGILEKRRGIGMFVAEGAKDRLTRERQEHFVHDFVQPLLAEAAALGLDRSELIRLIDAETPTPREM